MKKFLCSLMLLLILTAAGCGTRSADQSGSTVPASAAEVTSASATKAQTAEATTQTEEKTTQAVTQAPTEAETIEAAVTEVKKEAEQLLRIDINGNVLYADFEDNTSAEALKGQLLSQSLTMLMEDYGGFEKVGDLPFSLPTNDESITTSAGDVILYQGNKLTIYYDQNTWEFTKVAKIRDADASLKDMLGEGTVSATFSIAENQENP